MADVDPNALREDIRVLQRRLDAVLGNGAGDQLRDACEYVLRQRREKLEQLKLSTESENAIRAQQTFSNHAAEIAAAIKAERG